MNNLLTISPSPHVHTGDSVQKIMYRVSLALLPALGWSIFVFGWDAIWVTLLAVVASVGFEYLIQRYIMKVTPTITDGSAIVTGLLLAFNVPANLPWWIVIIGAMVAIGVGKMSFGGLGANIFNPALVGRVFLLISFPVQMTSYPAVNSAGVDAVSAATPLGILKEGLMNKQPVSNLLGELPSSYDLLVGNMGGSLGEISALMLLIGGVYMLLRKVITWHTPVSVLGSMYLMALVFWLINPELYINPMFHILAGGAMLGALFMATDMVSSPMTSKGQIIYGVGIGVITMSIRLFGAYPEGISFAILIMNAFTPLINNTIKPKRFGGKK